MCQEFLLGIKKGVSAAPHRMQKALLPHLVGTPVDTKRRDGKDLTGLIRLHELIDGLNLGYRSLRCIANQVAAFSRISLSPATTGSPRGAVSVRRLRLVESNCRSHVYPPPDRRFARFRIVRQRSDRTALMKFQDDLFLQRLRISFGRGTPLLAKSHGISVCTFSLIAQSSLVDFAPVRINKLFLANPETVAKIST